MSYSAPLARRRPLRGLGQTPPAPSPWDAIVPPECTSVTGRNVILPDPAELAGEVAIVIWPMVKWGATVTGDPMKLWVDMITLPMSVNDHIFNGSYASRLIGGNAYQPSWFPSAPNLMGPPCGPTTVNYGDTTQVDVRNPDGSITHRVRGIMCGGMPRGQLPPIGYMPLAPMRAWQDLMPADPTNPDNASPWPPPPIPWMQKDPGRWNPQYKYGAQRILEATGPDAGGALGPIAIGPMMAGWIPRPGNDQTISKGVAWIAVPLRQNTDGARVAAFLKAVGAYAFHAAGLDYHAQGYASKLMPNVQWNSVPAAQLAAVQAAYTANGGPRQQTFLASSFMGIWERSWGVLYNTGAGDPLPPATVTDFYSQFDANSLYTGVPDPNTMIDATGFHAPTHTDRGKALMGWLNGAVEYIAQQTETAVAITGAVLTSFFGSSAILGQSAANDAAAITSQANAARQFMTGFGTLSTDIASARRTVPATVSAALAAIAAAVDPASVDAIASQAIASLMQLRTQLSQQLTQMQSSTYAAPGAARTMIANANAAKAKYTTTFIVNSVASAAGQNAITATKFQVAKDVFKCIILGLAKDSAAHVFDAFLAALATVPQVAADLQASQAQFPVASAAIASVIGTIDTAKTTIGDAQYKRETELGLSWFMRHHAGLPMYGWLGIGGASLLGGLVVLRTVVKHHRAAVKPNRRRRRLGSRRETRS